MPLMFSFVIASDPKAVRLIGTSVASCARRCAVTTMASDAAAASAELCSCGADCSRSPEVCANAADMSAKQEMLERLANEAISCRSEEHTSELQSLMRIS